MDYCDASNPATGSKYDANANVENKNIATLIGDYRHADDVADSSSKQRMMKDITYRFFSTAK